MIEIKRERKRESWKSYLKIEREIKVKLKWETKSHEEVKDPHIVLEWEVSSRIQTMLSAQLIREKAEWASQWERAKMSETEHTHTNRENQKMINEKNKTKKREKGTVRVWICECVVMTCVCSTTMILPTV